MSNSSGPVPHRAVSGLRSPTSTHPGAPAAPSTPTRNISSAFGSPSALRAEEDVVILEIGSRYLRAGLAGDSIPKAVIDFGPDEQKRAGDYRRWEIDYKKSWRERAQGQTWGEAHELWRPDLRGLDLGLVGDKIDRAVREVFTKLVGVQSLYGGSRLRYLDTYSLILDLAGLLWLYLLPFHYHYFPRYLMPYSQISNHLLSLFFQHQS
jgi:hypothetical protein